jgi:amino acid transporter
MRRAAALGSSPAAAAQPWTLEGWGTAGRILDLDATPPTDAPKPVPPRHKLGQWRATAICGNDITSSVLYVAAICTLYAGIYAPLALLIVGGLLYLFRKIYAEAGSALPLNGGVYNILLNTTSKTKASIAACFTLLSYIATAVISSNEALHYAHHVVPAIPIMAGTVVLLGIFALLSIVGISESASVALVIFVLHMATLTLLAATSAVYVYQDGFDVLRHSLAHPPSGGMWRALVFGFAAGLLGISGFESSANFIEEQKPGVFPKTLRNMWIAVFVFNPLLSFLAFGIIPVARVADHPNALLAEMALRSTGGWLQTWVGIDAVLVLSGAVLTSYVGVTGLVRRMALDRCMPQFLLIENRARRTPHFIIIAFFILCCSILFVTEGKVEALAGVYTLSFLSVMLLFAIGNRLLAVRRGRLPREPRASWPAVIVAALAVGVGLVANVMMSTERALIFLAYFAVTLAAVVLMLARVRIMNALLSAGHALQEQVRRTNERLAAQVNRRLEEIRGQAIVFFTRGDGPANLRRAIEYVLRNEQSKTLLVVHVYEDESTIPPKLASQLRTLDEVFPEIRIEFVAVKGKFSPELVDRLSARLNVPRNYMFIGCPGSGFPHNLGDLGGVRLIV